MQFEFEVQGTGTLLVYRMEEEQMLDSLTMGMMRNNKIEGVLPLTYSQMDSDRFLKYNVSSRISLEQYFNGIVNKKRLLGVMKSIASAVVNAREYMIEPSFLVFDKEYIFVDVSTAAAQMVCLPIERENGEAANLEHFFKELVLGVQFDVSENCDYVARLLGYFNSNTMFSVEDFLTMLRQLERGETKEAPEPKASEPTPAEKKPPVPTPTEQKPTEQKLSQPTPPIPSPPLPGGARREAEPAAAQSNPISAPVQRGKEKSSAQPKKGIGFSLFGKKSDKSKTPPKQKAEKAGGISLPGRSTGTVPGIGAASPSVPFSPAVPGAVQEKADGEKDFGGIGTSYTAPSYEKQKASFGGTVVLNAGNKSAGTVVLNGQNAPAPQPVPYVLRVKNGQKVFLNGDVMKIGSDPSYTDFSVADNRAVSRSHADIRRKGQGFVLVDNNSTNHTFADGRMAAPNEEIPLADGMKFQLANEEFEFHLM